MPVYLSAALALGFYLCAVPVKFALVLRVGSRVRFGAGSAPFESRFALRRARRRAQGRRRRPARQSAAPDWKKLRTAAKLLRRLLRGARLESLRLSGRVGLSDAARTALAAGLVRSAEAALRAVSRPGTVRFDVEADFSGGGCELTLLCMFALSAGQIMLGALRGLVELAAAPVSRFLAEHRARRVREWTGTPLKTS